MSLCHNLQVCWFLNCNAFLLMVRLVRCKWFWQWLLKKTIIRLCGQRCVKLWQKLWSNNSCLVVCCNVHEFCCVLIVVLFFCFPNASNVLSLSFFKCFKLFFFVCFNIEMVCLLFQMLQNEWHFVDLIFWQKGKLLLRPFCWTSFGEKCPMSSYVSSLDTLPWRLRKRN